MNRPSDDYVDDRATHLGPTVWRYMSLSRFLWMLQNRRLWLARADTMNDPWELALAGDQLDHVILRRPISPLHGGEPEEPINMRVRRVNKLWRETTYMSCWSSDDHESYALWKVFCASNEGVAISTSTRKLGRALGNVTLHVVTYCEPGSEIRTPTATALATRKRLMFAYEREVRAIATAETIDSNLVKGELGYQYKIDPEDLVQSIAVHPEADSSLIDIVARAVNDYAPQLRDKVAWSTMRELPPLLKK